MQMGRFSVIGIDPGLDGAVAMVREQRLVSVEIVPTIKLGKGSKRDYDVSGMVRMLEMLHEHSGVWIFLEKQQAMPKQGVSSTFKTGRGFGLWEGIIAALGISLTIVHPRAWHSRMCKGIAGDAKARSILTAQRMFPETDFRKSARARVPHNGKTDAACIARYGWLEVVEIMEGLRNAD
jgi:crossover junction endodeoxyribonuclease RuvC